jgi:uncharacterized protein (UPF0264 family)
MRLLVSVRGPLEARAAVAGGADVVDAKDPALGALGAVRADRLAAIRRAVGAARPVSAALGDARDDASVATAAAAVARLGVAFVKLGLGGVTSDARARRLACVARRAAGAATALVLVAYADWRRATSLAPHRLVAVAAEAGAVGLLLDTAWKDAPLFALLSSDAVASWVAAVRAAGLFAALAGSLSGRDFATARALGAELVGVRGAACIGGRTGRVSRDRVAALQRLVRAAPAPTLPLGVFA